MLTRRLNLCRMLGWLGMIWATPLLAGEKIEFSKPAENKTQNSREPVRFSNPLNKVGPGSFSDTFKNNSQTILPAPQIRTPVPSSKKDQEARDEKKNWLFATPEDKNPTVEEAFKIKEYGLDSKEKQSVVGRYLDNSQASPDIQLQNPSELDDRDSQDNSKRSNIFGEAKESSGSNSDSPFRRSTAATGNGIGDFLTSRTESTDDSGTFSRHDRERERSLSRSSAFNQLFASPQDPINSLTDTSRQPVNPVMASPDLIGGSSQATFSDPFKSSATSLTGGQARSIWNDLNSRALGPRDANSSSVSLPSTRVKSQPAVLPFPARPGDIFKRPGSF